MSSLKNLPEIEFVSTDVTQIEENIITVYEGVSGRKLAPGDPVRLFLQAIAAIIAQQRVLINYAAKQNLLAYAEGVYLDHIGARVRTERLPAKAAQTTLRFTLSSPQPQAVVIPAGTRATPDGQIFFATVEETTVPAGTTQIDVLAECTTPGTVGNGWLVGQINKLIDPLPWIQKVENITSSSGGVDEEDDENYRERIRVAPESFSVAGPEDGYRFWAKSAHQSIVDVSVTSPAPGQVEIRPLLENGEIPSQEILDAVSAICNDKKIRPLTDQVLVIAPEVVTYNVELTYYVAQENATLVTSIQEAVTKAVNDYVIWQKSRLGRDVNPSELIARVMAAGAKRVEVISPVFTQIAPTQVAIAGTVSVQYGGLEDD
ncbi:baseplate assembly protein [Carboxydothermus pertinax]|uniref:Phage-related baseplate assembly protein n=1 Tax=Carboxydothermus pertinax TaxID=870242 RepID=A0A1L8CS30_9THEO|nr:baseplate J/gp47 family protein [Carboxydothermus pertinax]GAV21619.1 Phage-related baseplate assembly protein [Carboxydothermus pertinax]